MGKQSYVYIMTNKNNTVVYTGMTNNLKKRVYEHKNKLAEGFTKKYGITKLVYYEVFEDPENSIRREKQIKAGSRQKKIDLINGMNKEWRDLYEEI
jgi:putative endonuclease